MSRALAVLREVAVTLGAYVRGQLTVSLILTVLYAIGFALLRVPLWPLIAVVCGFLNLIPHFGVLVSTSLAVLLTWIFRGELWRVLAVLGVCVTVQGLEGFVISPRVLGHRLALPPLVVFLAVLAGGAMFGFVGLLLAVPVLAVAYAVYRFFQVGGPPKSTG